MNLVKRYVKWITIPLALMLAFILTSCSSDGGTDAGSTEKPDIVEGESPVFDTESDGNHSTESSVITLTINGTTLTATLVDNSSAAALKGMLEEGPLTLDMRDYAGMEKVSSLGTSLPTNNEQITTVAGDLILYQGSALVIYYAPNSWNFTRLGKIQNVTADELKEILGDGNVTVKLSLN